MCSTAKGGSDGGAGGAWAPPLFEALFKHSVLLENNDDCGFQLSIKAIVTNTRWLINCEYRPAKIDHLSAKNRRFIACLLHHNLITIYTTATKSLSLL